MRILIADDDLLSRKLLSSTLVREGHTVEAFDDGAALLRRYLDEPAPIVVTDWVMPELDGVALCRRIRAERLEVHTQVVLVTSLSPAEHTVEAFRAGVDDFLAKPLAADLLARQVTAAARTFLAHREAALRTGLEISQSALGADHAGLLDALEQLKVVSREQRSYIRCRAFLRRQLDIATRAFGPADPRTRKLSAELAEMRGCEHRLPPGPRMSSAPPM